MPFEFWRENLTLVPFGFMLTTSLAEYRWLDRIVMLVSFEFWRENLSPDEFRFRFPSVLAFFEPDGELEEREDIFDLNCLEFFLILFFTVFFSPKTKNTIIP